MTFSSILASALTLPLAYAPVLTPPLPLAVSVSAEDPDDPRYIVPAGEQYTGVVLLEIGEDEVCTGTLLPSDRHILTAAHCFEKHTEGSERYTRNPDPEEVSVVFFLPEEDVAMDVARIIMHPDWRNDEGSNADLAVLELVESAPEEADHYQLYRDRNEVGQVFTRVGFGTRGTGERGEDEDDEEAIMRQGKNRYEALGEIFNETEEAETRPGSQLVYDFDSGRAENDALGAEFDKSDLGLGWQEIGSSGGDSGGPAFIKGKIAGVSSTGMSSEVDGVDVTDENDTSFGEFFFDTRVSFFADDIDRAMAEGAESRASESEDSEVSGTSIRDVIVTGEEAAQRPSQESFAQSEQESAEQSPGKGSWQPGLMLVLVAIAGGFWLSSRR